VLIGRPVLWALATGGAEGVRELLTTFGSELARIMALCGAVDVAGIDRSLVRGVDDSLGERP
jgi:4-hydroxymandelate oxidase